VGEMGGVVKVNVHMDVACAPVTKANDEQGVE
jgi:hypothetical protein